MASNIEKLTATLAQFISESGSRATRLETNQEHLTAAVTLMTRTYQEISKSNVRLEEKIVSLEDKALDKLSLVEDSINEVSSRVRLVDERVSVLELTDKKLEGKKEAIYEVRGKRLRLIKVISLVAAILSTVAAFIVAMSTTGA